MSSKFQVQKKLLKDILKQGMKGKRKNNFGKKKLADIQQIPIHLLTQDKDFIITTIAIQ